MFLGIEQVWCIPDIIPFLNEHFSDRHILDMLNNLAVQVSD